MKEKTLNSTENKPSLCCQPVTAAGSGARGEILPTGQAAT